MRRLTLAGLALGVALPLSALASPARAADANPTRCKLQPSPPPSAAAATTKPQHPSRLIERAVRFARGGKRRPSDRNIVLQANPALDPRAEVFAEPTGDLEKPDASDSFAEEDIVVQTSMTHSGDLRLRVCIDPVKPETVEPGRYVGTIRISGPGVQSTAIPIEVTLRERSVWAVMLLVLGSIVGIVAKALADRKSADETMKAAGRRQLHFSWPEYVGSAAFIGGVLGGSVGALIAYVQIYAADPDWGTPLDMVALGLAAAAAQVSGRTIADWVSPYVPRGPASSSP